MNRLRLVGSLGLLLVLAVVPVRAQTAALGDKDKAAIRASTDAFVKSVLAADFVAVSNLYTEGATLMPPNQLAAQGRPAILAWMKAFPPAKELALKIVEIEGRGDLAYVRGEFAMAVAPPGAPGPVKDSGKYVEVRRRDKDGSWKIAVDIFNSDLPPPK